MSTSLRVDFNIKMTSTMLEDFNLPSKERTILLKTLQEVIGDVPPYFWAICQVCDLWSLEKLIEAAHIAPTIVRILATQAHTMVLYWSQNTQGTSRLLTLNTTQTKRGLGSSRGGSPLAKRQKTTDSLVSSPLLHRSKVASDLARERDGHCCVLSSDSLVEVAHIYPFYRLSSLEDNVLGARHVFWEHLRTFWPEEKVAAWEVELFPTGLSGTGDERIDNRITLSKMAHGQWNRGAFALKPISMSDENSTLKIQFFWQKKQPDIQATISLLTLPLSTEDLNQNEGAFDHGQTRLFNREGKPIKSGDIFDLKTNDPIKKPLPSFKLLELRWFLMRIIGMAGAAFPYEPGSGDDSDEDIPGLDLDEVGDTSIHSDIPQSNPLELLYEVNKLLVGSPRHYTAEAEGDGVEES